MLKFDASIFGGELPVCLGVVGIAVVFPGGDFLDEDLFVGDAAIEALGREDAEFRLGQIEPAAVFWSVVPFEALDQAPGFDGRKGFVEWSLAVDAEIVLDQNDGLGVREVDVGQVFQDASVIHGGMTICDLDMTPAFERSKHHEEAARAGLPRTPSSSPMRIGESMCLLTLLPGTWRWYFVSARRECWWWKRTSDFLPMRDDPAAANPRLFSPAKLQNASHRPAPWHRNIKSYDVEIGTLDEAGL